MIPPSKADIERWGVDMYAVTVHSKWLSLPGTGEYLQRAIHGPWPARTTGFQEMCNQVKRLPKGL